MNHHHPTGDKGMSDWQPIEIAPMVLVYRSGGVMLGYQDELGNWRHRHHGRHKQRPSHWMSLPNPPTPHGKEGER